MITLLIMLNLDACEERNWSL